MKLRDKIRDLTMKEFNEIVGMIPAKKAPPFLIPQGLESQLRKMKHSRQQLEYRRKHWGVV